MRGLAQCIRFGVERLKSKRKERREEESWRGDGDGGGADDCVSLALRVKTRRARSQWTWPPAKKRHLSGLPVRRVQASPSPDLKPKEYICVSMRETPLHKTLAKSAV